VVAPKGKPGDPGEPGEVEYGDFECCLVGWNWPAIWIAAVVAPAVFCPPFVVIVRGFEDDVFVVVAGFDVVVVL